MISLSAASGLGVGLALGAASIASVGPNTLMIIREGLTGRHTAMVASIVWIMKIALILTSGFCADALGALGPGLRTAALWLGMGFIAWLALRSLRAARQSARLDLRGGPHESRRACALRALGVVATNPLTYLEYLLLPASVGQSFAADVQLQFVAGLIFMASVGSCGYALGSSAIGRALRGRLNLLWFDRASGVVLAGVALSLAASLLLSPG